ASGWRDEIKKHADFKIVGELNGNDTVQDGFAAARDLLSANPDLAGIYCCNDPEALGAAQALKQAGKSGVKDVLLVGFNGDPPALELIKSGGMAATIRQDPYGQGQTCVKAATALMNNQPVVVQDAKTRSIFFPVTVVDAAHQANIPIVIGDVGATGDYDVFVLSDNYAGGQIAAHYMVEQLGAKSGTKSVAMITLHPGSAVGDVRASGWRDEIKKHDDFKIVGELNGNDTVQDGFAAARDLLSANPDLAGIYCCNDPEALGAAQALKQAGKSGVKDVLLVGFNGDPPALELIKSGGMAATIRQDPYGQGQTCVKAATALMNNQPVVVQDVKTRSIFFPVTVVDAANVNDVAS
ncbi:MAG TPA: substrate-binding domain-containing protein, partial [Thermomicrobiales bacterium]|nr:substrate-binding domain-containing protein [Thermomicrobiales bacterium]